MLFWPFMKTFTKQYARSFVHLISFNPHSHALRKILLSPFYKGRSKELRFIQGRTANKREKLGPTLHSVCSITLCSSPSPSPEITDRIFTLCQVKARDAGLWGRVSYRASLQRTETFWPSAHKLFPFSFLLMKSMIL